MNPFRQFLAVIVMLALAGPVTAQEPPLPQAAPRVKITTMGAPGIPVAQRMATEPMRLALNKTRELILPAAIRDIQVGNPDVVDVMVRTPTQVYLVGRGAGQSDVTFFDHRGAVIRRIAIDVHLDADGLRAVLADVMPDERNLRISGVGDSIYLSGSVKNDGTAAQVRALARRFVKADENVVTLLKVSSEQQVLMHVRVAEMQKTVLKELGVGVTAPATGGLAGALNAAVTTTGTVGLTQSAASLFGTVTLTGIESLVATFSALERQGLIKTLVEPNLTAVSGETANLLAGGEFPIPVAEENGKITIEFKQFGVLLNFTPVVLDPGRISLKMQTEVSAIDRTTAVTLASTSIPGLTVRRASSTVEMSSGGSIMIAGLLQNDITSTLSGLPGIMDIPILGALFKSSSFQRKETELVVIVSAYVVQPLEKPQLALPTDGFAPSSDLDRFLFNRLQKTYTRSHPAPAVPAQLQGPVGYIVP
jgi:pilus assembly protein CpaC